MSTEQLTRWFKAQADPPVRDGWYEVKCRHGMYGAPSCPGERLWFDAARLQWFLDREDLAAGNWCSFGRPCDQWRGVQE